MTPPRPHRAWLFVLAGAVALAVTLTLAAALLMHGLTGPSGRRAGDALPQTSWSSFGGAWSAQGDRIGNASEERGAKNILLSAPSGDLDIAADMTMSAADGEAGLMLRSFGEEIGVDAYHGYFAGVRIADRLLEFGRADFGWHPLTRISLPATMNLTGGFHLRAIAVGCRFGVELRTPDGQRQSLRATDESCIPAGHPGLRSTLTSTVWDHLTLRPATSGDLDALTPVSASASGVPLDQPYDMSHSAGYEAALRNEARRRALQAGVQPIASFLMQPGRHPDVTLQGAVISLPPLVAIQDDTNALIVPHFHSDKPLKLGDMVIAHGTVTSDRFRSSMDDAEIRVLWSDLPLPPFAVTAAQLTGGTYRGRTISLEGTLVSASSRNHQQELILRDGDLNFRGVGTPGSAIDVAHLETGSRLRLRGIAISLNEFTDGTYPFAVLVTRVDVIDSPPWWSPRHIAMLALASVALVLAIQFGLHRAQQWRLRSILQEREQLAFEMHDTLAQSFTGIAYQLKAASLERRGEQRVQSHIRNALEMVNLSHKEASRTIAALRPQLRDATAILDSLEQAAQRLADGGDLAIHTSIAGTVMPLPVQVTDAFFRVGQEAISNAVQHSGCTALRIEMLLHRREARLSIHDNGSGFDPEAAHTGLGLFGMRSRAAKIRGRVAVLSPPQGGTVVEVVAPLPLTTWLLRPLTGWLHAGSNRHPLHLIPMEPIGPLEGRPQR